MTHRLYPRHESGSALVISLMLMLMLSIIALAGIRIATGQERMALNVKLKNDSLQAAETGLRYVEHQLRHNPDCLLLNDCSGRSCELPAAVFDVDHQGAPAVDWQEVPAADGDGDMKTWFRVTRLGLSTRPVNLATSAPSTLYRVSVISYQGSTRTVLESIYAFTQS